MSTVQMQKKIVKFCEKAEELIVWSEKNRKKSPHLAEMTDEILEAAFEKLVDSGAEELLEDAGLLKMVSGGRRK